MVVLKILSKERRKIYTKKILILGLDNSGKSTILSRFLSEPTDQIPPTVGFRIKSTIFEGNNLDIWDIGGQKSLRPYWNNYFVKADALIWVVDSADTLRLSDCRNELNLTLQEEKVSGSPLLILANKSDLSAALPVSQISDILDFAKLKKDRSCVIESCSAHHEDPSVIVDAIRQLLNLVNKNSRSQIKTTTKTAPKTETRRTRRTTETDVHENAVQQKILKNNSDSNYWTDLIIEDKFLEGVKSFQFDFFN